MVYTYQTENHRRYGTRLKGDMLLLAKPYHEDSKLIN
jgi:hypothetical protein